jgi:hypothetical protein
MVRRLRSIFVAGLILFPIQSYAQSGSTGAIAGTARDTTGAVLPGVTVEAASPALIEKVRAAVTDAQGNYRVTELRPGTYTVTFTLPGFGTYKRENIELNTGVTAAVNAEMKVGSLEETVTVTGASPVVDVQNVRKQVVLTREVLDVVPTGKTFQGFATLTLGARGSGADGAASAIDVGGNKGEGNSAFGVHGMRGEDAIITQDGMFSNAIVGAGSAQNRQTQINQAFVQEMTLLTSGIGAESQTGGVQINIVPREGGNAFKLYVNGTGTGSALQNSNIDDELRQRGVTTAPKVKKVWDFGGGFGGPIKRDALWFYTAHRYWGNEEIVPGNYFNLTPRTFVYTPDFSRPAFIRRTNRDDSVRLTWQASAKNKLALNYSNQYICNCYNTVNSNIPHEPATTLNGPNVKAQLTQATWNRPATNRLLFEAGWTFSSNPLVTKRQAGVEFTDIPLVELTTGLRYNAVQESLTGGRGFTDPKPEGIGDSYTNQANGRFVVSYVTGSHSLRSGVTLMKGAQATHGIANEVPGLGPVVYMLRNGSPVSVQQWVSPAAVLSNMWPEIALYAQDQWTTRRLTMNLGVRYDHHESYVDAISIPAGTFVGAYDFPRRDDLPNWNDVSPRLGASYDLNGNGKTAIKVSFGRYLQVETVGIADTIAPSRTLVSNVTRTWADANQNFFPDCDLRNPLINGECGQISNLRFGTPVAVTAYDPEFLTGFGVRPDSWQTTVGFQHELRPGVALTAGYYRSWNGNFTTTDNRAVVPADFDPFCVNAPTDTRLGSVSGTQLCGLYDVKVAKFGQVDNLITANSNFGERTEVYNGFDVSINARFGEGGLFQGGLATGRTVSDNCAVVDSPQAARAGYCRQVLPFKGQTQVKLAAVYPLPYGLQFSGTYQNLAGTPIAADLVYTNAQVAPSLGRNLAAGAAGTVTVPLLPANQLFEQRLSQLDIRFTKIIRLGGARIQGMFDVYNALNANSVLAVNNTYGSTWLRPTTIMGGRLLKFGGQLDW